MEQDKTKTILHPFLVCVARPRERERERVHGWKKNKERKEERKEEKGRRKKEKA